MISRLMGLLRSSRPFRYVLVGGAGYLFEMLVLFVMSVVLHSNDAIAVTASFWLGLVFSFFLQKVLAFGNREANAEVLGLQAGFYALLVLFNYGFTLGFAALTAPVIGVFLSRTAALVITTAWNYFLYRGIIFNDKFTGSSSRPAHSLSRFLLAFVTNGGRLPTAIVAIALSTTLVLMAFAANPIADDYAYYVNLQAAASPLDYVVDHYLTHNGRLSQNILVTVSFLLFGKLAIQIVPVMLFLSLAGSLAWVFSLILPMETRRGALNITLGLFAAALGLFAVPSTVDSYLWLTSSTVYLGSLIGLATNVALAIMLARSPRPSLWALIPALFFMLLSQSFSEPTALFAITAAGLWGAWELVRRRWRRCVLAALSFVALVAGFLVVFLSPGTIARRAEIDNPFSIRRIVIGSLDYYPTLFAGVKPWLFGLILLGALVVAINIGPLTSAVRFHATTLSFAVLIFLGTTYFVFAVSNFGSTYFPYRNFTLPAFGLVISIGFLATSAFKALLEAPGLGAIGRLATPIAIVLAVVALPSGLLAGGLQLQALALRDSAAAARAAEIAAQLVDGTSPLVVQAVPVLVVSEAVEVENPSVGQIPWLIDGFRGWYGIPADRELVVRATPVGYCLPPQQGIRTEFACG